MTIKIAAIMTAVTLLALVTMIYPVFGASPDTEEKKRFNSSRQFDSEAGTFRNRLPGVIQEAEKKLEFWPLFKKMFFEKGDMVPAKKMAEVQPDLEEFLNNPDELKTIWLGHSTFLLNMNGKTVLVDPVFSDSAAPVSFLIKRFQKPVLSLKELPEIDFIVISHDHYDHLDMKSIQHFRGSETKFLTPLGVGSHLVSWGIDRERIIEMDWWESEELDGIKFVATPVQHFSGRGLSDRNHTLWASWVIQSKDHNVYFSGDSGYDVHFKEIGDTYGPFDVAFIESGQYNRMWDKVHLMPDQFVQTFRDLGAKSYFPVHWGMFKLSTHAWNEPVQQLFKLSQQENFKLHAPKIGEVLKVKQAGAVEPWWLEPVAVFGLPNFSITSASSK